MHRLALALLGILSGATLAAGQAPARWDIRASAAVDLWYHGLAVIGYQGPGPLPFYSDAYARAVRADKEARQVRATQLDRDGAALRAAFARDPAFESLHFLPLYSPGEWPERLVDLVRAVSGGDPEPGQGVSAGLPARDAELVAALRAVFATPAQRQLLLRFANALESEWHGYLRDARQRDLASERGRQAATAAFWMRDVAPLMGSYLSDRKASRGMILLSPALGAEGRFLQLGDLVIVAVQSPAGDTGGVAALSAVRELCFPVARAGAAAATHANRGAATAAANRAVARCSEMVLQGRPDLVTAFQELFP